MDAPTKAIEIKATISAMLALLTALWGWLGWLVVVFAFCILLDYFTGTWAAKAANEWSSKVARQGLWHKLGEIVAVLVAALCDIALRAITNDATILLANFTLPCLITPIVTVWYIFTELGSIIENAGKLGAPIPAGLRKAIAQFRDKAEKIPTIQEVDDDSTAESDSAMEVGDWDS